jgi:hypothetical protein
MTDETSLVEGTYEMNQCAISMALNNLKPGVSVNGTSADMNLDIWHLILEQVRSITLIYV